MSEENSKYHEVDDVIEYDGALFIVEKGRGCEDCSFRDYTQCPGNCRPEVRADKKQIVYSSVYEFDVREIYERRFFTEEPVPSLSRRDVNILNAVDIRKEKEKKTLLPAIIITSEDGEKIVGGLDMKKVIKKYSESYGFDSSSCYLQQREKEGKSSSTAAYQHPSGVKCVTITRHHNFNIGNAIKYLWRQGLKTEDGISNVEKQVEDLKKAVWYINDEIERIKGTTKV